MQGKREGGEGSSFAHWVVGVGRNLRPGSEVVGVEIAAVKHSNIRVIVAVVDGFVERCLNIDVLRVVDAVAVGAVVGEGWHVQVVAIAVAVVKYLDAVTGSLMVVILEMSAMSAAEMW